MSTRGLPVGTAGNQAIDPSENVKALSEASSQRQDDLRELQDRLTEEKIKRIEQVMQLRADHAKEIRILDADRLKAIREVDMLNQSIAAARSETAIQTLASATSAKDEAMRSTVATTERTLAAQAARDAASVNERLTAIERMLSSGIGGQEALEKAKRTSFAMISAILGVAGIVIAIIVKM